jgi:hypothetical protein
MPDVKHRLPFAARRWPVIAALLCICACTPDEGELVVLLDAGGGTRELRVYASEPPSTTTPALPAGVTADTAAIYVALADSAARLDSTYQRERTALNAEAIAMRAEDRRSSAYRSRYQAFERRVDAATALRARRDSLRRRMASLERARPGLTGYARTVASSRSRTAPSPVRRVPVTSDTLRVGLPAGAWWLTVGEHAPIRIAIERGASDTVRLR